MDTAKIVAEGESICTLTNAYFARLHTDQLGHKETEPLRMGVVNPQFHMPRTRLVFDWVFGLDGISQNAPLEYFATPNTGLSPEDLVARLHKERAGAAAFEGKVQDGG